MASILEGLSVNRIGWGPALEVDESHRFVDVPFAAFSKSDRIGRICDWTTMARNKERDAGRFNRRAERSETAAPVFTYDAVDEEGFHLVDTRPVPKPKWGPKGRTNQPQNQRGNNNNNNNNSQQSNQRGTRENVAAGRNAATNANTLRKLREKEQVDRRSYERSKVPRVHTFSVTIAPNWNLHSEIAFAALQRLSYTPSEPEDVIICGSVRYFNKQFDRLTTKSDKRLDKTSRPVGNLSTLDDPIIQRLASEGKGNVFATDLILSVLMAAPRSILSWDIVVTRAGDNLFFFSRDEGNLDAVTVNETAHEPPDDDSKDNVNSASNLDNEAYLINRTFQQQVGSNEEPPFQASEPLPTASDSEDAPVPEKVYRYRRWKLEQPRNPDDDEIEYNSLVVRCEIDSVQKTKENTDSFLTIRALNEFDPKAKDSVDWRQKIDSQPGAVLASCLKNNSNKLARWTCQALLGGTDLIKIGYVSRVRPQDNKVHAILGCKSYRPPEFARQMDVNLENVWGIIKGIVDNCMALPNGQYVLVKDPNNPIIRLYEVPEDAFDNEEEPPAEEDEDNREA